MPCNNIPTVNERGKHYEIHQEASKYRISSSIGRTWRSCHTNHRRNRRSWFLYPFNGIIMFTKSVDPILYFVGAIFVSVSAGFMTDLTIGFMVFGLFCVIGSFLK
jgi:hypothetical protein